MPWVLMPRSWIGRLNWLHRLAPQTRSWPLIATGVVPTGGLVVGGALVGGLLVGTPVVGLTVPVQAVPLRLKLVGTGLAPDHAPVKPMEVAALVPSEPFQLWLAAVTRAPDWVHVALQPWV